MGIADVTKQVKDKSVVNTEKAGAKSVVGGSPKTQKYNDFRDTGMLVRQSKNDKEIAYEGSKSDTIVYLGALGNPMKKQARVVKDKEVDSYHVVGYSFRALEDLEVPKAKLVDGFKDDNDVGPLSYVEVKAGEIFYLNRFEMGALISQPEYSGKFTGEGVEVTLKLAFSATRVTPLPTLNTATGSVKENMILVADVGEDGPVVKREFEDKFDVLFAVRSTKAPASVKVDKEERLKDLSAAFNTFVKAKEKPIKEV